MAGQLNLGSPFSHVLGLLVFQWCFHCLAVLFDVRSHGITLPLLNNNTNNTNNNNNNNNSNIHRANKYDTNQT